MKSPRIHSLPTESLSLSRRHTLAAALSLLAERSAGAAPGANPERADFNGFDVSDAAVPLRAIQRGGPPKDGIPAIDRPKFVTGAQSSLAEVSRGLPALSSQQHCMACAGSERTQVPAAPPALGGSPRKSTTMVYTHELRVAAVSS